MACKHYHRVKMSREQLRLIFQNHDRDGDGRLSNEELTEAFRFLGAFLPSFRARQALRCADSDRNGFITQNELDELLNYAEQRKYTVI